MQIIISGAGVEVGNALSSRIEDAVRNNVSKYFDAAIRAHVTISKEGHHFRGHLFNTRIVINEGTGNKPLIKSSAMEVDPYLSFNEALKKMEKQLYRYRSKLKNHHRRSVEREVGIRSYTISPEYAEQASDGSASPLIIAEKAATLQTLSVTEAVMQMDLMNRQALLFINQASNKLNLVYYRSDGNITWLDTDLLA